MIQKPVTSCLQKASGRVVAERCASRGRRPKAMAHPRWASPSSRHQRTRHPSPPDHLLPGFMHHARVAPHPNRDQCAERPGSLDRLRPRPRKRIGDRAGVRPPGIDREEKEYQAGSQQLGGTRSIKVDRRVHGGRVRAEPARRSPPRISADTKACEDEYTQVKQQIDDQYKKDHRKAKKAKEETGWHALTVFEGTRDEGTKWRRATEANWSAAIRGPARPPGGPAEVLLKRFGRLTVGHARRGRRRSWLAPWPPKPPPPSRPPCPRPT